MKNARNPGEAAVKKNRDCLYGYRAMAPVFYMLNFIVLNDYKHQE